MATTTGCNTCGSNVMDLSGTSQLKRIERMIADNYTIIVISIITLIILGIVINYFGTQLYNCLKRYYTVKSLSGIKSNSATLADGEEYDEDNGTFDPLMHFDQGKTDFVKNMEVAYKDYNKLKGDYIQTNYKHTNDDSIDQSALYSKYDDYSYTEQQ